MLVRRQSDTDRILVSSRPARSTRWTYSRLRAARFAIEPSEGPDDNHLKGRCAAEEINTLNPRFFLRSAPVLICCYGLPDLPLGICLQSVWPDSC